jgi:raffinose/stachyose/melibiose transport system permease protein
MTSSGVALRGGRQQRGGAPSPLARQRRRIRWPFVLPAVLLYTVLFVAPSVASVFVSLHRWQGVGDEPRWLGIDNYTRIVNDDIFRKSFLNTLAVLLVVGAIVFAVGFLFTVLVSRMRGKNLIRALIFFPSIVNPVVLAIAWGFILDPTNGVLNTTLDRVGLEQLTQVWLGPDLIFPMILLTMSWMSVGLFTVILMAGADRIPTSFYEDCELAGATEWQRFRLVTLPLLWDVAAVAGVLWVITAVKAFEFIYAFAGVGTDPPRSTWTASVYVYMRGFGADGLPELGQASAMAVVMVGVVGILVVALRRLMRRQQVEY